MKALVYHGPGALRWQDWPEPQPGPDDVLIEVRAAGICGSDLHGYEGRSNRRHAPMVMGHELAGDVAALGARVDRALLGRRVVVQPFVHCGRCEACARDSTNLCRNRRYIGTTCDGGMAERVAVPAANVLPIDGELPEAHAVLVEPLAVALHAAGRCDAVRGARVRVAGGGAIGLLTLVALRAAGAAEVQVVEPLAARRATAIALGAADAIAPQQADADGDDRFDVAVDAVGAEPTFAACLAAVRPAGTVLALGGWTSVRTDLSRLVTRELQVIGSFNFTPATFERAKRMLERGEVDAERLVGAGVPMADGADAFRRLAERTVEQAKLVLTRTR